MEKKEQEYFKPFSLRLSLDERARLERDAGDLPIGAYIRSCLFENPTQRKRRGKRPIKDYEILAALLTKLGSSRIANNLNQLAKAANSGSLLLMPEIEGDLHQAIADISYMRSILMKGLGLYAQEKEEEHDP